MEYIKISDYNLELKHIITGPAPVGRILNYVILTGKGILKHKHGQRDLMLYDGVGSAWCTEFLVGLGLSYYKQDESPTDILNMYLTKNGKKLYNEIRSFNGTFDESKDPTNCKEQLLSLGVRPISVFETVFRESVVFKNLDIYIQNNGKHQYKKNNTFIDNYFETFKKLYEGGEYNRNVRTTAGQNRVPSLLQLCSFFGYVEEVDENFIFDLSRKYYLDTPIEYIDPEKEIDDLEKEQEKAFKSIDDIESKYGIDGNVLRESLVRNSRVQEIFRLNLFVEFESKCAISEKSVPEILVASHIKESSKSNIHEKIDHNNGLLLTANYDRLFDKHLISFDFTSGKILISNKISKNLEDYGLSNNLCLSERVMTDKRKEYLIIHNMEFHQKNKE